MKSCTARDKVCNKPNAASMATRNSVPNFSAQKERYFSGPPKHKRLTELTEEKASCVCCCSWTGSLLWTSAAHWDAQGATIAPGKRFAVLAWRVKWPIACGFITPGFNTRSMCGRKQQVKRNSVFFCRKFQRERKWHLPLCCHSFHLLLHTVSFCCAVLVNSKAEIPPQQLPWGKKQWSKCPSVFWTHRCNKGYNGLWKALFLRQGSYVERELRIFSFCWRHGRAGPDCLLAAELLAMESPWCASSPALIRLCGH